MEYRTGSLVDFRGRNWVILPESDTRLLSMKPLGGHELEAVKILKELHEHEISSSSLSFPIGDDLGNMSSGKLLYHASRLALRTGSGPFRSFGKLSVRPRSYQVVPLVMALRQDIVRLLIADDVGIGKTIEALLILKEMIERGVVERFAILCPPHLCDQWHSELLEKFGIESEIVSSSTAGKLDRKYHGDEHHFKKLPAMVISIDYLKSEKYRSIFVENCPEMVIVDEAHNAAAADTNSSSQQMRYALLKRISENERQHLILLTATPHSGKEEVFQSLIGLLKPEFRDYYLARLDGRSSEVKQVAKHFVQRRRKDILDWLHTNDFPERITEESAYTLHPDYLDVLEETRSLSKTYISTDGNQRGRSLMKQWAMLSLLRGIASSPSAGALMLRNKVAKQMELADEEVDAVRHQLEIDISDQSLGVQDTETMDAPELSEYLASKFRKLAEALEGMQNLEYDYKAKELLQKLVSLVNEGYRPIVFCRFIRTAEYLQETLNTPLRRSLGSTFDSVSITSNLNDEQRRERIDHLCGKAEKRVLFATDCLSEGINLQEHFDAVIHYDLPWNPNRLEQREGRVDRFGQPKETVKAITFSGDHTLDRAILKVLIRKIREIREAIGVTIQVGKSQSLIESMSDEVFSNDDIQLHLALDANRSKAAREELNEELERTKDRELQTRTIFKQLSINPKDIEPDLVDSDEVLGNPDAVKEFMTMALEYAGTRIVSRNPLTIDKSSMDDSVWQTISTGKERVALAFEAPYPDYKKYIGRTHPFVERLSSMLMKAAFERSEDIGVRRASVVYQKGIDIRHVIVLFRVRNVIRSKQNNRELVAEELYLWGFKGSLSSGEMLESKDCNEILSSVRPTMDVPFEMRERVLKQVIEELEQSPTYLEELTRDRTQKLIDSHTKYSEQVKSDRFVGVEPVLPPDPIAVYIIQPDLSGGLS